VNYVFLGPIFFVSLFWFGWAAIANFVSIRKEKTREQKLAYPTRVIVVMDLMVLNLALFWFSLSMTSSSGEYRGAGLIFGLSGFMYFVLSIFCLVFFTNKRHKLVALTSLLVPFFSFVVFIASWAL